MSGEKPVLIDTGIQDSATAIVRGNLLIFSATASDLKVVRATANAAKPAGVAHDDGPGLGKTFARVTEGIVKVKVGAAVTQGAFVESDANGLAIDATAGAGRNTYGRFLEAGAAINELVPIEVRCQKITV